MMFLRNGKFLAVFLLILGVGGKVLPGSPLLPPEGSEAKLEKRIRREVRPIRKVRLQIKLARLRLRKSAKSYGELRIKGGRKYLKGYIEIVELAFGALQKSGRDPTQNPQGFKDLEIAIRQDTRLLEDLKQQVPYDEREGIQGAINRVDEIREQVLESLFATGEVYFDRGTDIPPAPAGGDLPVNQVAAVLIASPGIDRDSALSRGLRSWLPGRSERSEESAFQSPVLAGHENFSSRRRAAALGMTGGSVYQPHVRTLRFVQLDSVELGEAEVDRIRDAQETAERIRIYLKLSVARLDKFDEFRAETGQRIPGKGHYLDSLLKTYNSLYDELKEWIEYQYEKNHDIRKGLRYLLKEGPVHLERLRQAQKNRDQFTIDFSETLEYVIDNVEDTLQGGTQALRLQEERFKNSDENEKGKKKQGKRKTEKRRE